MVDSKLVIGLKFAEKLFSKRIDTKKDFQELISYLIDAIQEVEYCLDGHINSSHGAKLKICLLQLRYTINKMSEVLSGPEYQNKTAILKLLNKKIYLCLKETLNLLNDETTTASKSNDLNYHSLMSDVLSALNSPQCQTVLNGLIDDLLCSCLTIAKLSILTDFNEISTCCKNVLNTFSFVEDEKVISDKDDFNFSQLLYQVELLERKINTALLRLFLHIMCYPQGTLKKLVKKSGSSSKSTKFSEDLDDEISEFDLTCDRIALIGNFAIKSCEQESLKLKVQNCLANLEFCEESIVPACIDFYLDPNIEKREFLKYLSNEWKSEALHLSNLLDSIVDPATFSLVVFEDLIDIIHNIKTSEKGHSEPLFQDFYHRCMKFNENISKSPDCLADSFLAGLKKSLVSALKINENKSCKTDDPSSRIGHLEIILSLVDQISEHLNKILNSSLSSKTLDITCFTLKNSTLKDSGTCSPSSQHQNISFISKEWEVIRQEKGLKGCHVPISYLEKARICSPFVYTMYQKTPVRKKIRDHVALTLDVSKNLGQSFDA